MSETNSEYTIRFSKNVFNIQLTVLIFKCGQTGTSEIKSMWPWQGNTNMVAADTSTQYWMLCLQESYTVAITFNQV